MLTFLIIFCVIIALGFGLAAAWSDYSGMVISNVYPAGIMLSFVLAYTVLFLTGQGHSYFAPIGTHLLAFGIMLGVTLLLYFLHMIGAGDSKLAATFSLWAGLQGLGTFLFFMAITGGLLGLVTLALKKWKPVPCPKEGSWIAQAQSGRNAVPYGIAITVGAIMSFCQQDYFNTEKLSALAEFALSATQETGFFMNS